MNDMVERVARSIDPIAWAWIEKTRERSPEHPALSGTIDHQMAQARAVISSMREPTEAMSKAAWSRYEQGHIKTAWRLMIDAAMA